MSTVPAPRQRPAPRLAVVRGRRVVLPRVAMAPWLLYTGLLALAFLGLAYAQTSLNATAMELDDLRAETVVARAEGDALRLEIARLSSPDRVIGRAEELGMQLPDVPLRTLLVDAPEPRGGLTGAYASEGP